MMKIVIIKTSQKKKYNKTFNDKKHEIPTTYKHKLIISQENTLSYKKPVYNFANQKLIFDKS